MDRFAAAQTLATDDSQETGSLAAMAAEKQLCRDVGRLCVRIYLRGRSNGEVAAADFLPRSVSQTAERRGRLSGCTSASAQASLTFKLKRFKITVQLYLADESAFRNAPVRRASSRRVARAVHDPKLPTSLCPFLRVSCCSVRVRDVRCLDFRPWCTSSPPPTTMSLVKIDDAAAGSGLVFSAGWSARSE